MVTETKATPVSLDFETHPSKYRHVELEVKPPIAWIRLNVKEDGAVRDGYALKLNSYDMGVDMELADAVQRLRFEHPEVGCVIVSSALEGVFCSGANIFMLGSSPHGFKVNFCKFTNETRLSIEDATEHSGQTYIAAVNGVCSGGGYELALACKEIYLVDDRRSAVALPEIPYLGVLPGTGGLTRLVDKRKIPPDRADVFVTLAEGFKGKRAKEWGLVDDTFPPSRFNEAVEKRAREIARQGHPDRKGVELPPLGPNVDAQGIHYRHLKLLWGPAPRTARMEITVPDELPDLPDDPAKLGGDWFPLRLFREIDDVLCRLRFNHPETGLVLIHTRGRPETVRRLDEQLLSKSGHWFVNEVIHLIKRALKRMDVTAKSFFAIVDPGSCFVGTLFELVLAADRSYGLDQPGIEVGLTGMNAGRLPMGNGLSRLQAQFLGSPDKPARLLKSAGTLSVPDAEREGLLTMTFDDIDWEDEIRLAIEERASLSPDALTGMEASIRFPGPETMESKIFGRLSSWQNWIFQRPNAVGPRGALRLYGRPESPQFDWERT